MQHLLELRVRRRWWPALGGARRLGRRLLHGGAGATGGDGSATTTAAVVVERDVGGGGKGDLRSDAARKLAMHRGAAPLEWPREHRVVAELEHVEEHQLDSRRRLGVGRRDVLPFPRREVAKRTHLDRPVAAAAVAAATAALGRRRAGRAHGHDLGVHHEGELAALRRARRGDHVGVLVRHVVVLAREEADLARRRAVELAALAVVLVLGGHAHLWPRAAAALGSGRAHPGDDVVDRGGGLGEHRLRRHALAQRPRGHHARQPALEQRRHERIHVGPHRVALPDGGRRLLELRAARLSCVASTRGLAHGVAARQRGHAERGQHRRLQRDAALHVRHKGAHQPLDLAPARRAEQPRQALRLAALGAGAADLRQLQQRRTHAAGRERRRRLQQLLAAAAVAQCQRRRARVAQLAVERTVLSGLGTARLEDGFGDAAGGDAEWLVGGVPVGSQPVAAGLGVLGRRQQVARGLDLGRRGAEREDRAEGVAQDDVLGEAAARGLERVQRGRHVRVGDGSVWLAPARQGGCVLGEREGEVAGVGGDGDGGWRLGAGGGGRGRGSSGWAGKRRLGRGCGGRVGGGGGSAGGGGRMRRRRRWSWWLSWRRRRWLGWWLRVWGAEEAADVPWPLRLLLLDGRVQLTAAQLAGRPRGVLV